MTDGGSDFQLDHSFGEKPQCPPTPTYGRGGQSQRNDLCFLITIEYFATWRRLSFLALQGDVESFGNEAFADIFNALPGAEKGIGDVLVCPTRTIGIGFEQNVRSSDFGGCSFQFFDSGETLLAFFVTQADNVNLFHGKTSVQGKPNNNDFTQ
jgi:hypothetical protein